MSFIDSPIASHFNPAAPPNGKSFKVLGVDEYGRLEGELIPGPLDPYSEPYRVSWPAGSMWLSTVIAIVDEAHSGQTDQKGEPYILHCLRVMLAVHDLGETAMAIAACHDVLEDCRHKGITPGLLAKEFGPEVAHGVAVLTHQPKEMYFEYIRRIRDSGDPVAIRIKREDLRDNSDPRRAFPGFDSLLKRYQRAERILDGLEL